MPESSKSHKPAGTSPKAADAQRRSGSVYTHRNRTVQVPEGYLAVGYVSGVHGLRGELRIDLYTDFPERFAPGVLLYIGAELTEVEVVSARPHKNQVLLGLAGICGREAAEALRGAWLFVKEEEAVRLEADVYWVHDIVGLDVETVDHRHLGTISEVLFTGANEVYVVKTPPDVNQGRDLLLPAIADVVQQVDLAANLLVVRLLPGLLEE